MTGKSHSVSGSFGRLFLALSVLSLIIPPTALADDSRTGGGAFFARVATAPLPTIDGTISPGEWSAANTTNITLNGFNTPGNTITASWYYMNDKTSIYIALNFSVATDFLVLDFDDKEDHSAVDKGEDYVNVDTGYDDECWSQSAQTWVLDTSFGGTSDGAGARNAASRMYEVKKPQKSGDSHDISALPGSKLGFRIETFSGGDYYRFPQNSVDHDLNNPPGLTDEMTAWMDLTLSDTGPNGAPVLAGGGVTPPSGNLTTMFAYSVTYTDADNDTPSCASVVIDGKVRAMASTDNNCTDGSVFTYSTMLAGGAHDYFFNFSDGTAGVRSPASGTMTGPSVTVPNPPALREGTVSPLNGTPSTMFNFTVSYNDTEGEPPVLHKLYVDGVSFEMNATGTDYATGVVYWYRTLLSVGNHAYNFLFSDVTGSARLPAAGNFIGPGVTVPNQAPVLSNGTVYPSNGSHSRVFVFSVQYDDHDSAGPEYVSVIIDGTLNRTLVTLDSITYSCETTLPTGNHTCHFEASDGEFAVHFPAVGELTGPTVDNSAPVARIRESPGPVRLKSDSQLSLDGSSSSDPDDDRITHSWTSDVSGQLGNASRLLVNLSVGSHNITLKVTDPFGLSGQASISVTVWKPIPEIALGTPVSHGVPIREADVVIWNVTVRNIGEVPYPEGNIEWVLDNRTVLNASTPAIGLGNNTILSFAYTATPGRHHLAARIGKSTNSTTFDVIANAPPVARITGPAGKLSRGTTLQFSAINSSDPEGKNLTYRWDFGDNSYAFTMNATHAYQKAGTYNVTLTATDTLNITGSASVTVIIRNPPSVPAPKGFIPGFEALACALAVLLAIGKRPLGNIGSGQ